MSATDTRRQALLGAGIALACGTMAPRVLAEVAVVNRDLLVPLLPGMVVPYAGLTAPTGWLFAFGQSLNTSTYADLYAVIGFTYGGSGSTFSAPDLRGRAIAGQDDMGGASANRLTTPINGDTLGAAGGTEAHALSIAELAAHTHGPGTLNFMNGGDAAIAGPYAVHRNTANGQAVYISAGATASTGSGTAHANVQPTIILNYLIKT